jgi:outer membrane immunogenic protein
MKKLLVASAAALTLSVSSALAADLSVPYYKAPLPPPETFSWTGFYLGVNGGSGWGTSSSSANFAFPGFAFNLPLYSQSTSGWLGGFQAGYNWQTGPIVLGVEGDYDFANIQGNTACVFMFNCGVKQNWVADATVRVGVTPIERLLMYVKGGAAWAGDRYTFGNSITTPGGTFALNASASDTRTGGLMGMGLEYAFMPHWSAKIEYDYIDFGTATVAQTLTTTPAIPGLPTIQTQHKDSESLMKAGVNYRF